MRLQHNPNRLKCHAMSPLLFTLVFQGLAFWALCCVAKAISDFLPLKNNPLQKPLHHITSPILKVTTLITPALIPKSLHIVFATFWLLAARVEFYLAASTYGLLPAVTS